MDELLIGQMAELNGVSERTLRVYHDLGLLIPARIDEETGYRYYSIEQCAILDAIQQLKGIGLSLSDIREAFEDGSAEHLAKLMTEQVERLQSEIRELTVSRNIAENLLSDCRVFEKPPLLGEMILEHLPERHMVRISLSESFADFADGRRWEEGSCIPAHSWETTLRLVKKEILRRGYPLSLFRKIGLVSKKDIPQDDFSFDAFALVDETCGEAFESAETLPAGEYLTLYRKMFAVRSKGEPFPDLLAMLSYLEAKGYRAAGAYVGEIVFETPALLSQTRDVILKLEIPIEA